MKADLTTIDHIFGKISYEIEKEFPGLEIVWIPHAPGDRQAALQSKIHKIEDHPAGKHILPYLEGIAKFDDPLYRLSEIGIDKAKTIFSTEKMLVCIFCDADSLEDEYSIRHIAYTDLFQVLEIIQAPTFKIKQLQNKFGNKIAPLTSVDEQIIANLGGDCFAGICLSVQGYKNPIPRIAKLRATQALQPRPAYKPELFAFPLVLDLAKLVYRNQRLFLETIKNPERNLFKTVLTLAREVQGAFDPNSLKSWADFCHCAQILAWSGIEPNKILGTAVYTCEDPFMRSDAYLASEILSIDPALMTNFEFYNPFADDEINERRHRKLCLEMLDSAILKTNPKNVKELFEKTAQSQNEEFLKGKILGWCASGFIELAEKCTTDKYQRVPKNAEEIFLEKINEIPWTSIRDAGECLIRERRKGVKMTADLAMKIMDIQTNLQPITRILSYKPDIKKTALPKEGGS